MLSSLLPSLQLCLSVSAWALRCLRVIHTRSLIKVIVVMEVSRLCALITAITIAANVVQHPCNDPIVPSRCAGPVIPFSGWISRVRPDKANAGLEGFVCILICCEGRRAILKSCSQK